MTSDPLNLCRRLLGKPNVETPPRDYAAAAARETAPVTVTTEPTAPEALKVPPRLRRLVIGSSGPQRLVARDSVVLDSGDGQIPTDQGRIGAPSTGGGGVKVRPVKPQPFVPKSMPGDGDDADDGKASGREPGV